MGLFDYQSGYTQTASIMTHSDQRPSHSTTAVIAETYEPKTNDGDCGIENSLGAESARQIAFVVPTIKQAPQKPFCFSICAPGKLEVMREETWSMATLLVPSFRHPKSRPHTSN